ncbi:MAG: hypothetical protein ABIO16_00375 [Nocardioides sp.]
MTTCARCGSEVGDAAACAQCGQRVLSPQSGGRSSDPPEDTAVGDWRTETAERPAVRLPVQPAPAASTPGPPRFPLYADELHADEAEESVSAHVVPRVDRDPSELDDDDEERGAPSWLPWLILAVVMVLIAVGGVWLLLSSGDDGSATDTSPPPTVSSKIGANQSPTPRSTAPETSASTEPSPSDSAAAGDPTEVAGQATAQAPRTAPPNVDAFGNRTTYVAGNMLDGSPSTCWRMAGDGSGSSLTFRLGAPTALTRVGLINGYAKDALVGGRTLDWYAGNRRVLSAQWVFDDGTTLDQPLGSTRQMQTIDLEAPVTTSRVTLRLVSVSPPGTGRSARDYTAVSEISLMGTPAA